jgi:hypothetical protein
VLRTISLRVPIIPNLVGIVGGWRLEFRTWYRKVKGDDAASAYVLRPLGTSFVSIYERSESN